MAGRGPAPSEKRQRPNTDPVATTELVAGSKVKAPPLPGSSKFSASTRAWYRTWCRSPQAAQFIATDWLRLHMLAPLVDRYFAEPEPKLLSEIRLNEQKLGATPEDRLRLRWRMAENAKADERAETSSPRRPRRRRDPRLQLVKDKAS